MRRLLSLDQGLARAEAIALGTILGLMILASAIQWVARTLGAPTSGNVDVLVRFGVLWMAGLGGALATQRRRHLAVDALVRFLPEGGARGVRRATGVLAAVLCGVGAVQATTFVAEEWAIGRVQAGLPEAALLIVLPLAFGLMSFHFAVGAVRR